SGPPVPDRYCAMKRVSSSGRLGASSSTRMSGSTALISAASFVAVFAVEFDVDSPGSLNDGRNAAGGPSAVNQEFIHSPLRLTNRILGMVANLPYRAYLRRSGRS